METKTPKIRDGDSPALENMSVEEARHYYDLAWHQMSRQHDSRGRMQAKLGTLLGFEFVLVALLLNVLEGHSWKEVMVPLSCMFVAWAFLMSAYRARGWCGAPNIDRTREHKDKGNRVAQVFLEVIDDLSDAYDSNERVMDFAGRMLNWAIVAIAVGVFTASVIVFRSPFSQ